MFCTKVEKQKGSYIKCLQSNRGGEYLFDEIHCYLKDNGILSELIPSQTPQRNYVSKRRNCTLLDMVWSRMSILDLALSFWGYAL